MSKKKRVLMVVFEFPPSNGGSVQRILSVYNGFVEAGWDVDVLTITDKAYTNTSSESPFMVKNEGGKVVRAFGLDAQESLSIKGKHISALSSPDRWGRTWIPCATFAGKRMIAEAKPDLIWSSSPTPSPHLIANKLLKFANGAKWIADYRDPFPYMHKRAKSHLDSAHKRVDKMVSEKADHLTFATKEMAELYVSMTSTDRPYTVVENGFSRRVIDEADLTKDDYSAPFPTKRTGFINFYYAGILYQDGRDPSPIFKALKRFSSECSKNFRFVFQGAGDGGDYQQEINDLGLQNNVVFYQGVSFKNAISNMLKADVLVLIQDEKFNNQIPGKLYEYIATNNKVLVKSPKDSASSRMAKEFEGVFTGYSEDELFDAIKRIYSNLGEEYNRDDKIKCHSREYQFEKLLNCANRICSQSITN
tara:strand:- start:3070 stop:4326 length:1257 start_codon:yes stop_codon:yes gene_type:complete